MSLYKDSKNMEQCIDAIEVELKCLQEQLDSIVAALQVLYKTKKECH